MTRVQTTILVLSIMIAGYASARAYESTRVDLQAHAADDQVVESFERDLNREATPAAPVRRVGVSEDPLYKSINEVLWRQTVREDEIAASFERAFPELQVQVSN